MSSMVTLTVLMEPEIPRILQGEELEVMEGREEVLEVMEGREEVLECHSKGRPQPEVRLLTIFLSSVFLPSLPGKMRMGRH